MDNFSIERFIDQVYADTASNNWRRLHGYPLRRKSANHRYKLQKKKKHNPLVLGVSGTGKTRYWFLPDLPKPQDD